jgi:GT2 family glycosyltransferase/glycosyltransferase involved in cell wall biosynthesis
MPDPVETDLQAQVKDWLQSFPYERPMVVVPVFNAYEDVLECLNSLRANTPPDTPILVLDDASTDPRLPSALQQLVTDKCLFYARKTVNSGFVGTVNLAFAWSAPRDVVVVNSDLVLPANWLERLTSAAYYRSTVATATPFTNHGTMVSIPYRNQPANNLVDGLTLEEIDARIRAASKRLYPILPTAIGHCTYFKRAALDVVGFFDEAFAPGYAEEVDFSQRAILAGFSHVLADDLFVYHKGSKSFTGSRGEEAKRRLQADHEKLIHQRYDWYFDWAKQLSTDTRTPLAWAIERAQVALRGYRIAVDATCLGGPVTGTQIFTLELIRALATMIDHRTHLSIIVSDTLDMAELHGVEHLVDEIVPLSVLENLSQPRFNLVHRNFQIRAVQELVFLREIAHRLIVSQLDFIAFANPSYADGFQEWEQYRQLTHLVSQVADGTILISQDVAQDARHRGMKIDPDRMCVISPGVDHKLYAIGSKGSIPKPDRLPTPPFILMLGTNFRHKNRVFALKLMDVLLNRYRWDGKLVFAGPNAAWGGSEAEEKQLLQTRPALQTKVCYLGPVSEMEKNWLLSQAALLLYPTVYEGFGLVPFEAAIAGTAALTTGATSLREVLGEDVTYLETLNPENEAELVWSFLTNEALAAQQVAALQARQANFTWQAAAGQAWSFYQHILGLPPRTHEKNIIQLFNQPVRDILDEKGKTLPAWRRRLALASYLIFAEGPKAVFREISQYIRWIIR